MEGRNREVRRLWESQGVEVSRLKRVRYGCIFLPSNIPVGTWVELAQKELNDLSDMVGLERKRKRRLLGKEKQNFKRQQERQKIRQHANGPRKKSD
jgi:23S rRNA pseudouridine2605 synthase